MLITNQTTNKREKFDKFYNYDWSHVANVFMIKWNKGINIIIIAFIIPATILGL